jgi:hypothetical protein
MTAMLLILVGCLAAWAHVLGMLERASDRLAGALAGDLSQTGGWMPSSALVDRRGAAPRARTRA